MNIMIILGHPDKDSFNNHIAGDLRDYLQKEGHRVFFNDLYDMRFDPVLSKPELNRKFSFDEKVIERIKQVELAG